ncbi:MAG: hypothetical protein FalmKO_00210 [Falsiruegeria mediterranea]
MTWLRAYADLRTDRVHEILVQAEDITSAFMAIRPFGMPPRQDTAEWIALTQQIAIIVEMQVKHLLHLPRPALFSEKLHPVIDTPDHSAYPSGHSTEAFAIATVLNRLEFGQGAQGGVDAGKQVFELAHRIAVNRTIAGVHYPIDSMAGAALGFSIGEAVAAFATGEKATCYNFDPSQYLKVDTDGKVVANEDFTLTNLKKIVTGSEGQSFGQAPGYVTAHWGDAVKGWTNGPGVPPASAPGQGG